MRYSFKIIVITLLIFVATGIKNAQVSAQGNSTIADIVAVDARFAQLNGALQQANLAAMFKGTGPYTLFAPTNEAMSALSQTNPNEMRQLILFHTVQGNYDLAQLSQESDIRTAFGKTVSLAWADGGLQLNGQSKVTVSDIKAVNGTIHVIDVAISEQTIPAAFGFRSTGSGDTSANAVRVNHPSENPAYISGDRMTYWAGVHSNSASCKGVSWTVHRQLDGVVQVGSDRATNPYRGDTGCGASLPLLCLQRDGSFPPNSSAGLDYTDGWASGKVMITAPIPGSALTSAEIADTLCNETFGGGARMAQFHDGNSGTQIGAKSGHDFWALGSLPVGERFWVRISDQPANPWNSENPKSAPPRLPQGENIFLAGADPAFIGIGQQRMSSEEGFAAGRGCKGLTWVLHKQINGKVQLGGDESSNPFVGDRPCGNRYPILCIRVDGWQPPANTHGEDFSYGWSGGWVKASNAVSGSSIDTREKANAVCQSTFGSAWRMAEFHDGSLGTANTDGWEFWAYGTMPLGLRYWVANNDQPANPWNR